MTKAERIIRVCNEKENGNMSSFARKTNVTPAYISKLKNKPESEPSANFIKEVSRVYRVNETWLLTGEGDMDQPMSEEQEIAQIQASLFNEDDQRRINLFKFIASLDEEDMEALERLWVKAEDFFKKGQ